jgi:hypothetical protein
LAGIRIGRYERAGWLLDYTLAIVRCACWAGGQRDQRRRVERNMCVAERAGFGGGKEEGHGRCFLGEGG